MFDAFVCLRQCKYVHCELRSHTNQVHAALEPTGCCVDTLSDIIGGQLEFGIRLLGNL